MEKEEEEDVHQFAGKAFKKMRTRFFKGTSLKFKLLPLNSYSVCEREREKERERERERVC